MYVKLIVWFAWWQRHGGCTSVDTRAGRLQPADDQGATCWISLQHSSQSGAMIQSTCGLLNLDFMHVVFASQSDIRVEEEFDITWLGNFYNSIKSAVVNINNITDRLFLRLSDQIVHWRGFPGELKNWFKGQIKPWILHFTIMWHASELHANRGRHTTTETKITTYGLIDNINIVLFPASKGNCDVYNWHHPCSLFVIFVHQQLLNWQDLNKS